MGWTFKRDCSKQDVIDHVTRFQDNELASYKTVSRCNFGNVLWAVVELTSKVGQANLGLAPGESQRFIACWLLGQDKDFGWGYKDICESMHPYQYNCPLTYLSMTPEQCPEWRAKVRSWHEAQKDRATWKTGDQVIYKGNYLEPYTLIAPYRKHSQARKSGWMIRDRHGVNWRLSSHQLKDAERVVDDPHAQSFDVLRAEQMDLI